MSPAVSGCTGNGSYPHWSIGGSSGTARVIFSSGRVDRHRCGDRLVSGSAFLHGGYGPGTRPEQVQQSPGHRARPVHGRVGTGRDHPAPPALLTLALRSVTSISPAVSAGSCW
jgi:hypothetical protein